MLISLRFLLLSFLLLCTQLCDAQIGMTHLSLKNFRSFGYEGFLKFSLPLHNGNYVTFNGGIDYYSKDGDEVGLIPILAGYRYMFNKTGSGLFIEPNAGYAFGWTTVMKYIGPGGDSEWGHVEVAGPMAGISLGYLFRPSGSFQIGLALRYEHGFGNAGPNIVAVGIAHTFTFGRRNNYY